MIAGIDFSTRAVDVVLLSEDSDAATWHRFELHGDGAFDRTRSVALSVPGAGHSFWDDVLAVGIEQPRGNHGVVHMARIQGAVLTRIPTDKLVHPINPSDWRKTVGLPGNCSKDEVRMWVTGLWDGALDRYDWPQDACDAYCIALATRSLLQHDEKAA